MLWIKGTHESANCQTKTAHTKIPYVIFQPTSQFFFKLYFTLQCWHIIPLKFSSWNIICFGQKELIKVQFFRLLSALMKVHPVPHAIFEATRSEFIPMLHYCSVSWKITPLCFFSLNLIYFEQKEPIEVTFSDIMSVCVKIYQISLLIFETTSQFFFKLCITLHCHER